MRLEKRKIITLVIVLVWMAVIFLMSNQPAEESSEISGSVSYRVVDIANTVFLWDLSKSEMLVRTEAIQYPVRKCAHMSEYAILAILLLCHLYNYAGLKNQKRCWIFSWLLSAMYAATDEFHQIFIRGRSGSPIDVCIDATGACIGLLILSLCYRILSKRRGDRNE
jgi:VanZ family protein